MSWAEAMKDIADVASRSRVSTDANVIRSATPTYWDPYEVWLTRVKQPRELAASRATADAESQVRKLGN
jgi:hypothetical protein